jgi:hypothetical protein
LRPSRHRAQERRPAQAQPAGPDAYHRQLTLFEPPSRTLAASDGVARDPVLAG